MLKTHQTVHLKSLYFIICKYYFNNNKKIPVALPLRNTGFLLAKEKSMLSWHYPPKKQGKLLEKENDVRFKSKCINNYIKYRVEPPIKKQRLSY